MNKKEMCFYVQIRKPKITVVLENVTNEDIVNQFIRYLERLNPLLKHEADGEYLFEDNRLIANYTCEKGWFASEHLENTFNETIISRMKKIGWFYKYEK